MRRIGSAAWCDVLERASAFVVLGDLGIRCVADELVAGIHVRAADDDDVVGLPAVVHLHRPRRAALGVSRREVRDEHRAAELHLIAVVEDAIDLRGRVERGRRVAIVEVALAAGRQPPRSRRPRP